MSHQVQLSPAASHRPTAVLNPAWHAAESPACLSRCPYSPDRTGHVPDTSHPCRSELHGHLAHLRQRAPDKHEDRQPRPTRAVLPRSPHLSAGRPDFPRRGKRPEDTAGTWRAALHTGPSGPRSASKAHDRDRPAGYPGATCHRPPRDPRHHQMQANPNDHAGHPILHDERKGTTWYNSQRDGVPVPRMRRPAGPRVATAGFLLMLGKGN
jgi:hypothetical protein